MSDNKDLKAAIQIALTAFEQKSLVEASLGLLQTLGYTSERRLSIRPNTADQFQAEFAARAAFNPDAALISDWKSVDLLFQITDAEIQQAVGNMANMFASKKLDDEDIRSYLFFAVELNGEQYTRAQLAGITREINKLFPMPVMVIFRYDKVLSLAIVARRINKRDGSKDVLEKVTLIKDIRFTGNRAQIEILHDLAITQLMQDHEIANFVDLQKAWEKTLDLNELNKKFYKEIANWYFWAVKTVKFPKDAEKDEAIRNATSVIRLITRLIFVWFIKEKGLVPEELFDKRWLDAALKYEDPKKSAYYKAILQNLFFATLNTEMGAGRVFRRENAKGQDPDYLMSNFYRYKRYFENPDEALKLFAGIPFLNGGLFECLDKEFEKGKIIRVDGFSDRDDNPLTVPDDLFLLEKEKEIDLNAVYDTKNKKYKVRGLIHIFNSYKFTIEENTPIEEEIALDPELLGKVFENLLAAYNPETGTTARKQTGSFYTPREIVNYMVDEALLAYLNSEFKIQNSELENRLRDLLSYNPTVPDFTEDEKTRLIAAIDHVKALDPAAGSGAFPMGVLHKLVFLLAKLDPDNEGWKQKQISKANEIQDSAAREAAVRSIEEVFTDNHNDYGRKLFLIENCIYGVDIQPIAVQIAKLRFFISLVVDQKKNADKPNLGILQLPNLETKFVAANTLIGIQRPDSKQEESAPASTSPEVDAACEGLIRKLEQYLKSRNENLRAQYIREAQEFADVIHAGMGGDFQPLGIDWIFTTAKDTAALKALLPVKREAKASPMVLRNQQIEEKEKELERVRREHFSARTPATKRMYRDLDKKLRLEIADLLSKNHALADETAQQLAGWDPYNQNAHADFFDPEWMFGIEGGFDVVIGNPPWGADVDDEVSVKQSLNTRKSLDSSEYFILKSFRLFFDENSVLSFVVPKSIIFANSWAVSRDAILSKNILSLGDAGISFEEVNLESSIFIVQNKKPRIPNLVKVVKFEPLKRFNSTKTLVELHPIEQDVMLRTSALIVADISDLAYEAIKKIQHAKEFLENYEREVFRGLYLPDQLKEKILGKGKYLYVNKVPDVSMYVIEKVYKVNLSEYLSEYGEIIKRLQRDRIIVKVLRGSRLTCAYATKELLTTEKLVNLIVNPEVLNPYYVLGLLNSKLTSFYLGKALFSDITETSRVMDDCYLNKVPIKRLSLNEQKPIVSRVTKILAAKRANPQADTSPLEREIDQLVYGLYGLTEDEIAIVEGK